MIGAGRGSWRHHLVTTNETRMFYDYDPLGWRPLGTAIPIVKLTRWQRLMKCLGVGK